MIKKFQNPSCASCKARLEAVFCKLTDEELNGLLIQKHCNYYEKGQTVFNEGNLPTGLYCINKGKVKISRSGSEGKEQIIRLAKDSDIIGYRALISGESYSATASVIEDSKICVIPKTVFYELIQNNPDFTASILKLLANDLKKAENKLTNIAQKPVLERVAEALLMLKEYYGLEESDNSLNVSITREEMANIVGTATETLIRLMSELRKEGLIELEGKKIRILKSDALLKLANLYD